MTAAPLPSLFKKDSVLTTPRYPFCTQQTSPMQDSTVCYICQFEEFDFDSLVDTTFTAVRPTQGTPRPPDYSAWHAMAEAGFQYFFPGTNPNQVHRFLPIYIPVHTLAIGCLFNSVYSYSLRDDTWGLRSPSSYRCGSCYSPLRTDIQAFSQFWGARTAFPGRGYHSVNNSVAHIYPRQVPIHTLYELQTTTLQCP